MSDINDKFAKHPWERLSDKDLLELRFCDLDLKVEESRIAPLIEALYCELEKKHILFKPHVWISEDWFAMDGIPGIAVPFYTMHKRLSQLCKKMMIDDEGFNKKDCLKLLRHETGHAIDNAYKLRLSRQRQNLFGLVSTDYPDSYAPNHEASKYVAHLNPWYSQAHPDEDWAETFATWLNPNSNWKNIYKDAPAIEKLNFIDSIMKSIKDKPPLVIKKNQPGDITNSRRKLKTFFSEKIETLKLDTNINLTPLCQFIFSNDPKFKKKKTAVTFIKQNKDMFIKKVSFWTGHNGYTINLILQALMNTCKDYNLHLTKSEKETRLELMAMLTTQVHNSTLFGLNKIKM